jgi:low affinity Fe/Cu permease
MAIWQFHFAQWSNAQMRAGLPIQSFSPGVHVHAGSWFSRMANATAEWTGRPLAFLLAFGTIVVWAITGPLFHYSDTWQLVINTGTTIVTFLMVFLIQNTQNRDTLALQVKLSELILALNEADNRIAAIEESSDEELQTLHEEIKERALRQS